MPALPERGGWLFSQALILGRSQAVTGALSPAPSPTSPLPPPQSFVTYLLWPFRSRDYVNTPVKIPFLGHHAVNGGKCLSAQPRSPHSMVKEQPKRRPSELLFVHFFGLGFLIWKPRLDELRTTTDPAGPSCQGLCDGVTPTTSLDPHEAPEAVSTVVLLLRMRKPRLRAVQ